MPTFRYEGPEPRTYPFLADPDVEPGHLRDFDEAPDGHWTPEAPAKAVKSDPAPTEEHA